MKIFYFLSIACGMVSFRYCAKSQAFTQTKAQKIWAFTINGIIILMLPIILWNVLHILDANSYNPVTVYSSNISTTLRIMAILYTVVCRYSCENAVKKLSQQLLDLEREYLSCLQQNDKLESLMCGICCVKFMLVALQAVSAAFNAFIYTDNILPRAQCLLFIQSLITNVLHLAILTHFLLMCHICRALGYVNIHLQHILEMMLMLNEKTNTNTIGNENENENKIHQVLRIHWKLRCMVMQLNSIFRFQILIVRFTALLSNVVWGYAGCVYVYAEHAPIILLFYGLSSYMAMTLDTYVNDLLSDWTINNAKKTLDILRLQNEFNSKDFKWQENQVVCSIYIINYFYFIFFFYQYYLMICGFVAVSTFWLELVQF